MKLMRRFITLAALMLLSSLAYAQSTVTLHWQEPTHRENGQTMAPEEIGGYELRYYALADTTTALDTITLTRAGSPITSHALELPAGDYIFEIAAFDVNGLYSEFVPLQGGVPVTSPPAPVEGLRIEISFNSENIGGSLVNFALNKPVEASSVEQHSSGPLLPEYAVDGDQNTRWGSQFTDNEWILVDLGTRHNVRIVRIYWQNSHSVDYRISGSLDKQEWFPAAAVSGSNGELDEIEVDMAARYVKVEGSKRATQYGHSIFELEVYGTTF